MINNKTPLNAITCAYEGLSNVIITQVKLKNPFTEKTADSKGLWDTGATNSCITRSLASDLGLIQIGQTNVSGVHGLKKGVPVYALRLTLNNENITLTLSVTECEELSADNSCGLLIGMDVITKGDFVVSNFNGKTVMSFRTPSVQRFDFVQGLKNHTPIVSDKLPGRNDPCYCGSGKKYKNCHGKS